MIQIANPIYDSVFKYMMQNNKVCVILLGALLNRDVVEVEVVNNELIRVEMRKFAVLRLDFLAKIKNPDGTIETVSIELQKSEKSTEIVLFRSYLASLYDTRANDVEVVEYANEKGEVEKIEKKHPHHIIAIYILGHALAGIDEPVIYNSPNPVSATGEPVKNASKNSFFNNLTHDTIIVQIPRLRRNVKSRVEEFLDIFDQSRAIPKNEHFLLFDDITDFDDKPEGFAAIVRELARAAADHKTKIAMDIEDEYADDVKTFIRMEELKEQLAQQKAQLSQKDLMIVTLIKSMLSDGKTIESVSKTLNITESQISELLSK